MFMRLPPEHEKEIRDSDLSKCECDSAEICHRCLFLSNYAKEIFGEIDFLRKETGRLKILLEIHHKEIEKRTAQSERHAASCNLGKCEICQYLHGHIM